MKNLKRPISLLLVLLLALGLLPGAALAGLSEGDWSYTVEGGKATITQYNGSDSVLTIPSSLGGYPVTAIGDSAIQSRSEITMLTVPEGVVSVGNNAFANCYHMVTLSLPASLASLGSGFALGCSVLATITLPETCAASRQLRLMGMRLPSSRRKTSRSRPTIRSSLTQ